MLMDLWSFALVVFDDVLDLAPVLLSLVDVNQAVDVGLFEETAGKYTSSS